MAQLGIDVRNIAPQEGADPVPAGWYNAAIRASEVKPTASGTGFRLALTWAILDGQFANRKVFSGHNIRNDNPKAQEIAMRELSAIGHAVNVLVIEDSAQLHDKPMKIKVKLVPPQDQYEAKNEITLWKNINDTVGGGVAAGAHVNPAAAPPAPAPQLAPQQAPNQWAPPPAQAATQQWAPPAAAQPWATAPQQAPQPAQQAPAPQQFAAPPVQQAAPQWAPPAQPQQVPPVAQPPAAAPVQPAAGPANAPPPWATAPQGAAPAWNQAPAQ